MRQAMRVAHRHVVLHVQNGRLPGATIQGLLRRKEYVAWRAALDRQPMTINDTVVAINVVDYWLCKMAQPNANMSDLLEKCQRTWRRRAASIKAVDKVTLPTSMVTEPPSFGEYMSTRATRR